MFHFADAMKEEHLDPARDSEVSVADDLRRVPKPYVDEKTGLLIYERDYLRRNHETSEYTRLWYRSIQREDSFLRLDSFSSPSTIACFADRIEIECPGDSAPSRVNIGTLLHGSDGLGCRGGKAGRDHVQPIFREITANMTTIEQDGKACKKIVLWCKETDPFLFFGNTSFHFFSNHSHPERTTQQRPNAGGAYTRSKGDHPHISDEMGSNPNLRQEQSLSDELPSFFDDVDLGFCALVQSVGCGFTVLGYEIDLCGILVSPLELIICPIEKAIEEIIELVAGALGTLATTIQDYINQKLADAGLNPIWNGIYTKSETISLFKWNYDNLTQGAAENPLSLVSSLWMIHLSTASPGSPLADRLPFTASLSPPSTLSHTLAVWCIHTCQLWLFASAHLPLSLLLLSLSRLPDSCATPSPLTGLLYPAEVRSSRTTGRSTASTATRGWTWAWASTSRRRP